MIHVKKIITKKNVNELLQFHVDWNLDYESLLEKYVISDNFSFILE